MFEKIFGKKQTPAVSEDANAPDPAIEVEELFLKPLFSSAQPIGDVIFIHGMGGNWQGTWASGPQKAHWAGWLAEQRQDLNFWSLQYPASPSFWAGKAIPLQDRAVNVLELLKTDGIGARPICFVTHSLGGLLAKQMLRTAATGGTEEYKQISEAVRGLVFLSTPHTGADLATIVHRIGSILRATVVIEDMRDNAALLRDLNQWYIQNCGQLNIKTKVFFEKRPIAGVTIVDESSGGIVVKGVTPIGIDANHSEICKPASKDALVYKSIRAFLNEVFTVAPAPALGDATPKTPEPPAIAPPIATANDSRPATSRSTSPRVETPAASNKPVEIFFSYAREDEAFKDELVKHLKLLKRQNLINAWHDREVSPGMVKGDVIDAHLESAQIILLLISADFINTEYCYDVELERAMERHRQGEARVIPIILRKCDWTSAPFGVLQGLPKDAKPIKSWSDQDEAFTDVAAGIRRVIAELVPSSARR